MTVESPYFQLSSMCMDFDALQDTKTQMLHLREIEYVWHKLLDNPDAQWSTIKQTPSQWSFPDCWAARFWLYFVKHRDLLQRAHILDLGSNMNFYGVWALDHGAQRITSIEPEPTRKNLGDEYVEICGYAEKIKRYQLSIDEFLNQESNGSFDVVFLLDVLYYLDNPIQTLKKIKEQLKPKYLFLESTVADDHCPQGHFTLWFPSSDPKLIQSFRHTQPALVPSRNALKHLLHNLGWQVFSYYDYMDFRGRGESSPRRDGHKDFYLLGQEHRI